MRFRLPIAIVASTVMLTIALLIGATVADAASFVLSWASGPSVNRARYQIGVVTAANGRTYAIGGKVTGPNNPETAIENVEELDPETGSWTPRSSLPLPRFGHAVAAAPNGKIYVFGGSSGSVFVTNRVDEYDPLTNAWTAKTPLTGFRMDAAATAASNGKIYLVGGCCGAGSATRVDEYDPQTDIWVARASMPTARLNLALTAANGKIYAIGGHTNLSAPLAVVEEYDPATNVWTTKAPMPTARTGLAAVTGRNGLIYAVGGSLRLPPGAQCCWPSTPIAEEYDPTTNSWASKAPMPTSRAFAGAAVGRDDKVYVVGGYSATETTQVVNWTHLSSVDVASVVQVPAPPGTTPSPSCSPRPPVGVTTQAGNGALNVTLAAAGTHNGIRAVRFESLANAVVDVGDQRGQVAPFAIALPADLEPTSLQFTIRRQSAGATTLRFIVIDGCGEWPTLVGGGPTAF